MYAICNIVYKLENSIALKEQLSVVIKWKSQTVVSEKENLNHFNSFILIIHLSPYNTCLLHL